MLERSKPTAIGRRMRIRSDAELAAVWQRWRQGALMPAIGKELGRSAQAVAYIIIRHGGIAPATRRRAARVLSLDERKEISRGLGASESLRAIGKRLGRAPSSISREIRRNGEAATYRAAVADIHAWDRARRPKACRLAMHPKLRRLVWGKLREDWSPEQISEWLVKAYPDDPSLRVSHETIYRTLYVQTRGALKKELTTHLRRSSGVRRNLHAKLSGRGRGQIVDAVPISKRPPEVADRAVPGHWEGDLLAGNKQSNIATLVERRSRYVMLIRLPARDTGTVVKALARRI